MKFVIWGAGFRGEKLFKYLGDSNVVAFIDYDKQKQGTLYCGKPVINIDEYQKLYSDHFVLISPNSKEIEVHLQEKGIYNYTNINTLPSEFLGYGNADFVECYSSLKELKGSLIILGLNALSLMIYDFLSDGHNIRIVPNVSDSMHLIEWAVKHDYPIYREIDEDAIVLSVSPLDEEKSSYNKWIDLYYYSSDLPRYYNKKLDVFKDSHDGESCFIVATGPSIRQEDLELIHQNKIFCFSMNSIIFYKCPSWKPDIYVCADSYFLFKNMNDILNYECNMKLLGDSFYIGDSNEDIYKMHIVADEHPSCVYRFSDDICKKIYGGQTVTYACMEIAIYMGFKKIFLLGVDNTITKNRIHCNESYNIEVNNVDMTAFDRFIKAYEVASKYSKKNNVEIYNATRGGSLEVFKRVDFDSLFV